MFNREEGSIAKGEAGSDDMGCANRILALAEGVAGSGTIGAGFLASPMWPDARKLDDLVRRIVDAVDPIRIILFGSAVRGEVTADSDVDIMVVMPDGTHRLNTMGYLQKQLIGLGMAVDIIVATPSDLAKHRDTIGYVYRTVIEEGQELYAA